MEAVVETVDFARAGARPEAGYTIIGTRGEDMAQGVPVEGPDGVFVGVLDAMCGVDGLGRRVGGVGCVIGGNGGYGAWRVIGFVEEVVIDGAVVTAGRKKVGVNGMPGESRDILLEAAKETNVSHHAEIEDSCYLIASTCRQ